MQYAAIGSLLENRRKELNLSLEHVHQVLKIRKVYLVAIECGDLSLLPNGIYAAGYMKQYADFLGLNLKEIQDNEIEKSEESI